MNFIANDLWSGVWISLLLIAGIITLYGDKKEARRILWVLCVNWLITRACVTLWPSNGLVWLLNDFSAVVALAVYGKTVAAKACALLFFIIFQFDIALLLNVADFAPIAAVSDALGYLILIIMAGAAYDVDGRFILNPLSNSTRFRGWISDFQTGRTISPSSAMPSRNISKNNHMAAANGMKNE